VSLFSEDKVEFKTAIVRFFAFVMFVSVTLISYAREGTDPFYQYANFYLSPRPNASWVQPGETLILRPCPVENGRVPEYSILRSHLIGNLSGEISGDWERASDGVTSLFTRRSEFEIGETVEVNVELEIGGSRQDASWTFTIRPIDNSKMSQIVTRVADRNNPVSFRSEMTSQIGDTTIVDPGEEIRQVYDLPADLPDYTVYETPNASSENLYIAPFGVDRSYFFHLVLNSTNAVQFYDQLGYYAQYWVPMDDVERIVAYSPANDPDDYLVYDTTFTLLETISPGNEFPANDHELQILPNGHVLILGHDYRYFDISNLVAGGQLEVLFYGVVIQELSEPNGEGNRNVLFQWKSLDDTTSIRLTDAIGGVDYTESYADYMHANSLDLADDGNYVISCRHLSQLIKISSTTGEVMWRMGKAGKQNDFTFINDPVEFSGQHYARQLDDGNWLFFDNGTYDSKGYARAVEYTLDEDSITAELVWQYDHGQEFRSYSRGSTQRLENGNTLIAWGDPGRAEYPLATEVNASGQIVWEIFFQSDIAKTLLYQVHRSKLNISADKPMLHWEMVDEDHFRLIFAKFGDDDVQQYVVSAATPALPLFIPIDTTDATSLIVEKSQFSVDNIVLMVQALYEDGSMSDTSNWVTVNLLSLDAGDSGVEQIAHPGSWVDLKTWPNPFNESATVHFNLHERNSICIDVFNSLGRRVYRDNVGVLAPGKHTIPILAHNWASGVYLLRIANESGSTQCRRIVLVR